MAYYTSKQPITETEAFSLQCAKEWVNNAEFSLQYMNREEALKNIARAQVALDYLRGHVEDRKL